MAWKPGDRVRLMLPDPAKRAGTKGSKSRWFTGTVRDVDPPGHRPGVIVDLDEPVKGVSYCFATHTELQAFAG